MPKDLTAKQFLAALARYGMKPIGFMGYVEIPLERVSGRVSVSMHNAGTKNRRAILAFLLSEQRRIEAQNIFEEKVAKTQK